MSPLRRSALALAVALVGFGAASASAATCASQNLTVAPLQSGVFYIDAAQSYLGSYVGYKVTNGGASTRSTLWMRLESFTGGVVGPADGNGSTVAVSLDPIAAGGSTPAYAYLKAAAATSTAQTHQLVLYDGRPGSGGTEVCRDTETISAVADVIKAAANKVTSASFNGDPFLGGTFSITVTGNTGTIGAGPSNDPGVVRFSPAVAATWPSSAFRLVGVTHRLPDSGSVFNDVLWRGNLTFGDTPYTVTYTFRVVGPTTTTTPLVPVQNIASGTQVKHTDPSSLGSLAPIPPVTSSATVTVGAPSAGPYTAGQTVPLTATTTNTGSGALALDEIVATLPPGWSYKPGTATIAGTPVADPFVSGSTLRFVGPFTVPANAASILGFDTTAGAAGTSGTYQAVGKLEGGQIDSTTNVADDAPSTKTLTVLGAPAAVDDTVAAASNSTSTFDVVANDSTAGGTPTITILQQPENGTATIVGGKISYTPDPGYSGPDSLSYTLTTQGGTSDATVTITVAAPPAPPAPAPQSSTGTGTNPQAVMLPVPAGGTVALVLPGGARTTSWTRPGVGLYELDPATGLLTFTPELGYTGTPSVDFECTDAYGQTGSSTYTATVDPPAGPLATPQTSTGVGAALQTAALPVPASDTATLLDGTTPVTSLTVDGEGTYTYDAADGSVSFAPVATFHGAATPVAYRVTDAYGQHDDSTYVPTVQLPAVPVVTAKTSTATAPDSQSADLDVPADGTVTLLDTLGQATDTVDVLGEGTYVLDPSTATVTFTPVAGFHGSATPVAYRASDAYGQTSASSTYTPTVNAPGAPSAAAKTSTGVGTAAQSASVTIPSGATVRLVDGGTLVTSLTVAGQGAYALDTSTGTITFTPVLGFGGVATPVTYRLTDAYGQTADATYTPTVTLPGAPTAPAASTTGVGTTPQSTTIAPPPGGSVTLLDDQGQPATSVAIPGKGTYTLDPLTGAIQYVAPFGYAGVPPAVAVRIADAYGQEATGSYQAAVTPPAPAPAPPRTSTGTGTAPQGDVLPVPPGGTVTLLDASGDPVTHLATDQGVYDLDPATGRVTFTPRDGYAGTAAPIAYVVTDGYGQESTGTYTPTVAAPPGPEAPEHETVGGPTETQAQVIDVPKGGTLELLDPSGEPVSQLTIPGQGTYVLDATQGTITFVPDHGFTGTPTPARYRVTDAYGQASESIYQPQVRAAVAATCVSHRRMTLNWRVSKRTPLRRIEVTLNGKRVALLDPRVRRVTVDMRGMSKTTADVRIIGRTLSGGVVAGRRVYHPCVAHVVKPPLKTLRLVPRPRRLPQRQRSVSA
jgi:CshA-type fibril repeat protein